MKDGRTMLGALVLAAFAVSAVFLAGGASIAESRLGTPYAELWQGEQNQGACEIPAGWVPYRVKQGETVTSLAEIIELPRDELLRTNCLEGELNPGETIFLPSKVTAPSVTPCGPPSDWALVVIEADVKLADLARRYAVSEAELRRANCLGGSTQLGESLRIYVPNDASSPKATEAVEGTSMPAPQATTPTEQG
jgi:hypothetical protein